MSLIKDSTLPAANALDGTELWGVSQTISGTLTTAQTTMNSAKQFISNLAVVTAGTSTAYTITPSTVITAYTVGQTYFINFNSTSGTSPTLSISGVTTPPNLVKQLSDGTYTNIAAGDIPSGHWSKVTLISTTQALVERLPVTSGGGGGGSFTGGTLTSALNEAPQVTIASSSTVSIGAAAANSIVLTGTTTVTAFDTIAAGPRRSVLFSGILTLTYNATSLILPTAANIITQAGDVAQFLSLGGGNWRCVSYLRADGTSLASSGASLSTTNTWTKAQSVTPVLNVTATGTITPDATASNNFSYVLTGNLTLANPTSPTDGQILNFRFKQDATGSRTLTCGSAFKFAGGTSPILSTAANAVDFMSCYYDATDATYSCSLLKGLT
jgi:hypothetical protein